MGDEEEFTQFLGRMQAVQGLRDAFNVLVSDRDRYRAVLEKIVKKAPEKVSREEAADMACEFKIEAQRALTPNDNTDQERK